MRVAQKTCEYRKVSIEELLEICPNCYYPVDKGVVVNHYVTVSYSKKLIDYARFIKPDPALLKKSAIKNMTFSFSLDFEQHKYKQALFLVNNLRRQAANYTTKLSKMQYFLAYGQECKRTQNVKELSDGGVKILDEESILELLNIDTNVYEQVKAWSLAKIRGYGIPKRKKIVKPKSEQE